MHANAVFFQINCKPWESCTPRASFILSIYYLSSVIQTILLIPLQGRAGAWKWRECKRRSAMDLDSKEEERLINNSKVVAKIQLRYLYRWKVTKKSTHVLHLCDNTQCLKYHMFIYLKCQCGSHNPSVFIWIFAVLSTLPYFEDEVFI